MKTLTLSDHEIDVLLDCIGAYRNAYDRPDCHGVPATHADALISLENRLKSLERKETNT